MNEAPTAAPNKESTSESKCQETSELTGNEIRPGKSCEARSFTGTTRLNPKPKTIPGRVSLSGKRWVSASVKIKPNRRNPKTQYFNAAKVNPKCRQQRRKSAPVSTSTAR